MPSGRGFWLRVGLGSLLIVVTAATATAAAGLVLFDQVADEIVPIPELGASELPQVPDGEPYTLLLLGSDRRPTLPDERSDTTMLVRLDPDQGTISLLSFPRDLLVDIPGHGFDKLNAAYSLGGPKLTLRTVEELTGLRVNEVIDTDFQGFADAVNAVDCVYVDVDRNYFAPPGSGYAEIDISAGYQRLCGLKALQYVRFRHTDNDIVRAARQQSFLREARQRVGLTALATGGGSGLLEGFTANTRSTINDGGEVRAIARTLFELRGASPVQIQIEGDLGEEDIRATDNEIERAVDRFLAGAGEQDQSAPEGGEPPLETVGAGPSPGPGGGGGGSDDDPGLEPADPQFARYAATASRRLDLPIYYPGGLAPESGFSRDSRTYEYENEDGDREQAYKFVVTHPEPTIVTEYYGLSGTTWNDPPILRDPSEVRREGGRDLLLFYSGKRLRLVGWKQGGNSYWVSNSLLDSLSESKMLAIATAATEA